MIQNILKLIFSFFEAPILKALVAVIFSAELDLSIFPPVPSMGSIIKVMPKLHFSADKAEILFSAPRWLYI